MLPVWGGYPYSYDHMGGMGGGVDSTILSGLTKFKLSSAKFRRDDDLTDRFSHTFTALLLVVFTIVISARQYIGKPIACWVPTEFTRAQEEYAEHVCWVTNTYFLPTRVRTIPGDLQDRENRKLGYYQWVPFVLMIQAFLFHLPCLVWRLFNWQSGIQLSSIMEVAGEMQLVKDPESRRANLNYLARYIEDALSNRPTYSDASCMGRCRRCLARCCCLWFGRRYGNYLVTLYLIVKCLYIINITGQFFLMNRYLGTNYTMYGLDLLRDLLEGHMWQESGNFPRITLCDFEIRRLGNVHRHTVQCVLPINMFNEKIYIFLWFWMAVITVLSVSSFFIWLFRCTIPMARTRFIRKYLKLRNLLTMGDRRKSLAFVDSFLRQDGVFIVRLIAQNSGELAAAELVERLWLTFKHRPVGLISSPINTDSEKTPSAPKPLLTQNAVPHGPLAPGEMGLNAKRRLPPGQPVISKTNRKRNGGATEDDPGEFV